MHCSSLKADDVDQPTDLDLRPSPEAPPNSAASRQAHAALGQAHAALAFVDALAVSGIREVIISPGSRSTPLVWAALRHSLLHCRWISDERAAAFFALGQARVSGVASLLICTSGSAPAHYLPAVIEASTAFVPLLIISADRPPELHHCGASQAVDQHKLYGDHVRFYAEVGLPFDDSAPNEWRPLRRLAAQAVHHSVYPTPGPVHLNAAARKPLEPPDNAADVLKLTDGAWTPPPRFVAPLQMPPPRDIADLAARCGSAQSGIIVCGPAPLDQARHRLAIDQLAHRLGFVLFAEATSQVRFAAPEKCNAQRCNSFDTLLQSPASDDLLRPDLILQIGMSPVSSGWQRWLPRHRHVPRFVLAAHGYPDAESSATALVQADLGCTLQALHGALGQGSDADRIKTPSAWTRRLSSLQLRLEATLDTLLEQNGDQLSEAVVVRDVVDQAPEDALLLIGNSLPIRHLDTWVQRRARPLDVLSQRGASGIDGLVAGACGAATSSGRPTLALLGDVSLLHDLGGLATLRELTTPLVLVLINNQGGRIFPQLPLGQRDFFRQQSEFWTTPPQLDFQHAAAAFGCRYQRPDNRQALRHALHAALRTPGATLIEAVVAADSAAVMSSRLDAAVDDLMPAPPT